MYQEPSLILRNNIKKIIVILGVLLGAILGGYLLQRTPLSDFTLHKTPYRANNFSQVIGNYIYSFNGVGFYKQDIKTGSVTVLQNNPRLATVEAMHWADDKGVLINFGDGSLTGSVLEAELAERKMRWSGAVKNYLWYFDFSTSELSLASPSKIMDDTVYYTDSDFYYIRDDENQSLTEYPLGRPLVAFSIKTKKESVLYSNTNVFAASSISSCATGRSICYVEEKGGKMALNSVKNGKKTVLTEYLYNTILPTSNPEVFIATKNAEPNGEDGEVLQADVFYLNVATKIEEKTGAKVAATRSLIANTAENDAFYILEPNVGNEDTTGQFINGGKTILEVYKAKPDRFKKLASNDLLARSILPPQSKSNEGMVMFSDTEDQMYLVTPTSKPYGLNIQNSKNTNLAIGPCLRKYSKYTNYSSELKQFKVGLSYDTGYSSAISDFSTCVNKIDPKLLIGYEFIFVGLSPIDGRFVTN